jgi:hypothetical protein
MHLHLFVGASVNRFDCSVDLVHASAPPPSLRVLIAVALITITDTFDRRVLALSRSSSRSSPACLLSDKIRIGKTSLASLTFRCCSASNSLTLQLRLLLGRQRWRQVKLLICKSAYSPGKRNSDAVPNFGYSTDLDLTRDMDPESAGSAAKRAKPARGHHCGGVTCERRPPRRFVAALNWGGATPWRSTRKARNR